MKVTDEDLAEIQKHFPNLDINEDRSKIFGEFSFTTYYDGTQLYLNPSRAGIYKSFTGYYEIEICLNNINDYGLPTVFETGGKIARLVRKLKCHPMDLHLNDYDSSCCLGIFTIDEVSMLTLYAFIVEVIFSFFAWQAFLTTFNRKPPWGEYSHGGRGNLEKNYENLLDMQNTGRNDPCPCGSGFKFKKCCIDRFNNFNRSLL